MAVPKTDPETSAVIFKPLLIRAGIALIFGAVTFIVQEPSLAVMNYGLAIYLVFSGSAMWEYLRRDPVPEKMRSPLSMAAAVWMLGALSLVGVHLFEGPLWASVLVAGAVLLLGGVAELVAWGGHRRDFVPARDQLLTGLVGVLSGAGIVVFMTSISAHQLLGITGSAAFIITVVCAVSGIGFWLDARQAARVEKTD